MRNPRLSAQKIPQSFQCGAVVRDVLSKAANLPEVVGVVENLLNNQPAEPFSDSLIQELRSAVVSALDPSWSGWPHKTAKADSPFSPELFWAWGHSSKDPDAKTLATWVLEGAPLGFSIPIPSNGIFPRAEDVEWREEAALDLSRQLEGWTNHPSAVEESEDLHRLTEEALEKRFCTIYDTMVEAEAELGKSPVLTLSLQN